MIVFLQICIKILHEVLFFCKKALNYKADDLIRTAGGIGRHKGLRILRFGVRVRLPRRVPFLSLTSFHKSSVPNKGRYWRRGKRPFAGSVLFPLLNLSRRSPSGEDGTPPPLSLVRRSLGEGGKPFPGIYLFALQNR